MFFNTSLNCVFNFKADKMGTQGAKSDNLKEKGEKK